MKEQGKEFNTKLHEGEKNIKHEGARRKNKNNYDKVVSLVEKGVPGLAEPFQEGTKRKNQPQIRQLTRK